MVDAAGGIDAAGAMVDCDEGDEAPASDAPGATGAEPVAVAGGEDDSGATVACDATRAAAAADDAGSPEARDRNADSGEAGQNCCFSSVWKSGLDAVRIFP
jgi:hypothetical protein